MWSSVQPKARVLLAAHSECDPTQGTHGLVSEFVKVADEISRVLLGKNADDDAVEAELVATARVVFCTLSVSGRANLGAGRLSAPVLIVDEAGQATEPEVLIAVKAVGPVVCLLAGDHKQLPATIISQKAAALGLNRYAVCWPCLCSRPWGAKGAKGG